MLGITVPDAIAFGMLIAAAVAMLRGAKAGEKAATTVSSNSVVAGVAGAILSNEMLEKIVAALLEIAHAIRDGNERKAQQHIEKLDDTIQRLMRQLDQKS